jgi:hypothetical protein
MIPLCPLRPAVKTENKTLGELNALTWGEEHDLKLAEMKRPREQEEARAREQALSNS